MYGPLLCPQGVKWSRIVTAIMRPLQCALVMQSNIWTCKCIVYQPNAFCFEALSLHIISLDVDTRLLKCPSFLVAL